MSHLIHKFDKILGTPICWIFGTLLFICFSAHACDDALVTKTAKAGEQLVISDFGCAFPEKMIFRLKKDRASLDVQPQPQDAVPFDGVCERLRTGGFRCGLNAPFGLAGSAWKPVFTKFWSCKPQNYRPPKFVCAGGCTSENRRWEFFIQAYEC